MDLASTRLLMQLADAGVNCLTVAGELRRASAKAFIFLICFARDNDLPMEARIRSSGETRQPGSPRPVETGSASRATEELSPESKVWARLCEKEASNEQRIGHLLAWHGLVPLCSRRRRGMRGAQRAARPRMAWAARAVSVPGRCPASDLVSVSSAGRREVVSLSRRSSRLRMVPYRASDSRTPGRSGGAGAESPGRLLPFARGG